MENKRSIGSRYEDIAAAYLSEQGIQVLRRNYRTRTGEIDLIGKEQDTYVFVEVKGRSRSGAGDPAEAVTWKKQERIRQTALQYLVEEGLSWEVPCRFDVVAILGSRVRWIPNAF